MNTGLTSITNLADVGSIYPFQGMEVPFVIGAACFLVFFIMRIVAMEASHHKAIIGSFTASPAE